MILNVDKKKHESFDSRTIVFLKIYRDVSVKNTHKNVVFILMNIHNSKLHQNELR